MNRKNLQVAAVIVGALLTGEWASVSVRAEESAATVADRVREQERIVEGEVTGAGWEDMVAKIRKAFGSSGKVSIWRW